MIKHAIGLVLHCIGIGLWFLLLSWLLLWACIFLVPAVPLAFILGYLTSAHIRTQKWDAFISFFGWEYLRRYYFRFSVHGNTDGQNTLTCNTADTPVIWAIYPHGHFAITAALFWGLDPYYSKKAVGAVHSGLFYLPFIGTMIGWIGAIPATRESMIGALRDGKSIYMTPGGVADITNRGNAVQKRTGFIRVAKDANRSIIPVWCPDERSYYRHWSPLGDSLKNVFGFVVPTLIWGRWWCPILPMYTPHSRIFIGKPITWDDGKTVSDATCEYYAELNRLQLLAKNPYRDKLK